MFNRFRSGGKHRQTDPTRDLTAQVDALTLQVNALRTEAHQIADSAASIAAERDSLQATLATAQTELLAVRERNEQLEGELADARRTFPGERG